MKRPVILNSEGKPINLNKQESLIANACQRQVNSLGYDVDITTLTTIMKKITDQKFFEMAPADYMPIRVGEGAWSTQLTTYRSFSLGDGFETGVMGGRTENARLASADAGVDSISVDVSNWAKSIGWTIMDLQHAQKAGNWDLVTAKEKARKRNWDLGIQKIAFLGMEGNADFTGLLNQAGTTTNVALITQSLSSMTSAQLKVVVANILDVYRANCDRSAWPTHFTIPESDFLGLASPQNDTFANKSVMEILQETFRIMTKNPNFKIQPCAYGDPAYNTLGVNRYALYNSEEESLRMDIPVDYTNTLANSIDNFSFQNVGYGQFTGVKAYRPKELLYFQF